MAELSLTVKIPALDRLCDWLEKGATVNVSAAPVLAEVPATPKAKASKAKATPEAPEGPKQPPEPEPAQVSAPAPEPTKPEAPASPAPAQEKKVTVDQAQLAAAELRDQGKLNAVLAMFPEFGIEKISDLKGRDADLQTFAARLRQLGATI